jgi:two-component system, OmpR family, phosphate regulon sensor histidine kinase PhoR
MPGQASSGLWDGAMANFALMQEILDALADPIVVVDGRREVLAANSAARSLYPRDLVGRNIALSIRHPDILEALEGVLGSESSRETEVTLSGAVATTYRVHIAPLNFPDSPEGFKALIAFQDLTAARQVEHMRADFVANVSHELRSPLTSLLGFIETLRGPARDDSAARERFLEVMDGEAKRMARLIDELLALSRVESEEHLPPRGRVDVTNLLHEIARSLDMRAAGRGMEIKVDCAGDLPRALGERDELTLVFRNLIENALNYGRAETPVTITAGKVERVPGSGVPGIKIAVRDRGDGIEAEHIPRLTERFYRVDKGRSRSMGGSGLGLAIVKHIANRHRGRLTIESTRGEGSVFTMVLPSAPDQGA